jgi:hypothetical protein
LALLNTIQITDMSGNIPTIAWDDIQNRFSGGAPVTR